MLKRLYVYGTYHLKTMDDRPIREAAYVKDIETGAVVRFTELLGKKRAYAQAVEIFRRRNDHRENLCPEVSDPDICHQRKSSCFPDTGS